MCLANSPSFVYEYCYNLELFFHFEAKERKTSKPKAKYFFALLGVPSQNFAHIMIYNKENLTVFLQGNSIPLYVTAPTLCLILIWLLKHENLSL